MSALGLARPMALLLLPLLTATLSAGEGTEAAADPTTAAATTRPAHDTDLGPLRPSGLSVMEGAHVEFRDLGQLHVVAGFAEVAPGEALPVDGIHPWFDFPAKPPRGITLVRDKATDKWLATDGVVAIAQAKFVLVDDQEVRVVGGPFKVRDVGFTDQTFVLRAGQPVVVAAAAPAAPTAPAASGYGTIGLAAGAGTLLLVGCAVVLARRRRRAP